MRTGRSTADEAHLARCQRCLHLDRRARELAGKRLGKLERRLLLDAAPPGASRPRAILAPDASPASQVAIRRSVSSLLQAGLLLVPKAVLRADGPEAVRALGAKVQDAGVVAPGDARLAHALSDASGTRPKRAVKLRVMWRTPLGEEVVHRYRRELESGRAIRWDRRLEEAREACLAACPTRAG